MTKFVFIDMDTSTFQVHVFFKFKREIKIFLDQFPPIIYLT